MGCEIQGWVKFVDRGTALTLLPSTAQRLVKLNHRKLFLEPYLRQVQLRLEQVPVGIQSVELGVYAPAIAHVGQSQPVLQRAYQRLLLFSAFPHPLVSDQGIGDLRKGGLNSLLVLHQRMFSSGSRQIDFDLSRPAVKIGCDSSEPGSRRCWVR